MGKKKEKVVDLKPQKITDEELSKVQSLINTVNKAQLELGMIETRKHRMLTEVTSVQGQIGVMQKDFEKDYGTFDINVQDGTINYPKDEPSDS